MCYDVTGVETLHFKMADSSDSEISSSELSEFEEIVVEPLINAGIMPWQFEPRGRPRDEREREERVDRNDRRTNTDW